MALTLHTQNNVAIIEITEHFDSHVAVTMNEWFRQQGAREPLHLIVDLARVKFIEADGLAVLVYGQNFCRQHHGALYLCNLQEPVRSQLTVTCLDRRFNIVADERDALQAILN